jgi:hypothetical protein
MPFPRCRGAANFRETRAFAPFVGRGGDNFYWRQARQVGRIEIVFAEERIAPEHRSGPPPSVPGRPFRSKRKPAILRARKVQRRINRPSTSIDERPRSRACPAPCARLEREAWWKGPIAFARIGASGCRNQAFSGLASSPCALARRPRWLPNEFTRAPDHRRPFCRRFAAALCPIASLASWP